MHKVHQPSRAFLSRKSGDRVTLVTSPIVFANMTLTHSCLAQGTAVQPSEMGRQRTYPARYMEFEFEQGMVEDEDADGPDVDEGALVGGDDVYQVR